MYYVYILQSQKDYELYKGFTSNLDSRLEKHNKGKVISTKNRRPFKLIYYEGYLDKSKAIIREKYFKTYLGSIELRKILEDKIKT